MEFNSLIVVIYRNGQGHLSLLLPDDVLVQNVLDLPRGRELVGNILHRIGWTVKPVAQDAHAKLHALVANAHTRPLDHTVDLVFVLAAE